VKQKRSGEISEPCRCCGRLLLRLALWVQLEPCSKSKSTKLTASVLGAVIVRPKIEIGEYILALHYHDVAKMEN